MLDELKQGIRKTLNAFDVWTLLRIDTKSADLIVKRINSCMPPQGRVWWEDTK